MPHWDSNSDENGLLGNAGADGGIPPELERRRAIAAVRAATAAARHARPLVAPSDVPGDEEIVRSATSLGHSPLPVIEGYEVISRIGEGGQGAVFQAKQNATGRTVAIKVLFGGPFAASRHRARFDSEVSAMANIDHPNVVGILDRGCTRDGSFFLAMDYVAGVPLDEYVRRRTPGIAELIRLFAKIAHAVEEIHRTGIVHRDLKPSNVFVDSRGEPRVMDFGLARIDGPDGWQRTAHTMTGQILGSIHWASPEAVAGQSSKVDPRADVYSLGVMFYKVLTGHWPYDLDGSIDDVFKSILRRKPRPATAYGERWNIAASDSKDAAPAEGLSNVLAHALAKSPADRPQSAGELAAMLEVLLDRRLPRFGVVRWLGRRPVLIAAVLALVAGVAIAAVKLISPARPPVVLVNDFTTNSIGMTFSRIPAGGFMMGSPSSEAGRHDDEQRRRVEITKPFYMSRTEVTRRQFAAVMGDNESAASRDGGLLPMGHVSWAESSRFCLLLSAREKRHYRLPTEAEWEYACRAGTDTPRSGDLAQSGWYRANSGLRFHQVGEKWANSFGLFDMHGNVAEWCQDWYEETHPPSTGKTVKDPTGPSEGTVRVIRGGNVFDDGLLCRSAARSFGKPNSKNDGVGFRVVFEADQPK